MTFFHHSLLGAVAISFVSMLGCSSNNVSSNNSSGSSAVEKATNQWQACGVLSEGKVNFEASSEADVCYAKCIAQITDCADIEAYICGTGTGSEQAYYDCADSCYSTDLSCDGYDLSATDLCDGYVDCSDGMDEADCEGKLFECGDGSSISVHWKCDGEDDCYDGSDEVGCPASSVFSCGSGEEFPAYYECDFEVDCEDGSDEAGCAQIQCN